MYNFTISSYKLLLIRFNKMEFKGNFGRGLSLGFSSFQLLKMPFEWWDVCS